MSRWPTYRQKALTFKRVGYVPGDHQRPIHKADARVIVVSGGERAGKSRFAAMEVVSRLPWSTKIAFVGQNYDKARPEMTYTIEALRALGALQSSSTPKLGQWVARAKTGCEMRTVSLERGTDHLTGTGEAFDIVVLGEWGLMPYNAFLAARGRVAETRGLVLAIGTLEDSVGWQADLYRLGQGPNRLGAESFSLPSWSNLSLFPLGEDDPEILAWKEALGDEHEIERRIDAKVVASPARMFSHFSELTHVKEWVAYDPDADVYLAVDAGYYPSRYAVLAIQLVTDEYGREVVHIVDEIWEHHKVHEEIVEIARKRAWADNVTLIIGGHETKQHQAAASTQEVWAQLWPYAPFEVFDAGRVLDGASRVRWLLRDDNRYGPRLYLSPICTGTAWEFEHYRRKTDRQGEVVSEDPQDQHNDAMDALRNFVVWRYGYVDPEAIREDDLVRQHYQWANPYG